MANAPESILLIWQDLKERQVRIPPEIWAEFDAFCLAKTDEISALLEKARGRDLPVEDARAVGMAANAIHKFLNSLIGASDGVSRIHEGRILLDRLALDLVRHHLGNDLYKIVLIADVYDKDPQPVPAADAARIPAIVTSIRDFIHKLKLETR
jgi:hypothetical protein